MYCVAGCGMWQQLFSWRMSVVWGAAMPLATGGIMQGSDTVCPESGAFGSKLVVGKSSGELLAMVHC